MQETAARRRRADPPHETPTFDYAPFLVAVFALTKLQFDAMDASLKWTVGLKNCANKYLTAEDFQNKVTSNGTTLRKKQIWVVESIDPIARTVSLKNCHGRYLTSDKDGKLDTSGEEVGGDQTFFFKVQDDGRIAILNVAHNRYVGGMGDSLTGYDQTVGEANLYVVQLAIHPQLNLRNVNRDRYCHLVDEQEVRCDEEIAWGYDAMFILEFHGSKYAIRTANNKYLSRTGDLLDTVTKDALFTLVLYGLQVAFLDDEGKYLTAVGASATVMSRRSIIGKDELFELSDSQSQFSMIAPNAKFLSIREGIEVRATQGSLQDTEIFQLEAVDRTDMSGNVKWAIKTIKGKYWGVSGNTIKADKPDSCNPASHFEIEWEHHPLVAIKAHNGKYISVKPQSSGQMTVNAAEACESTKFYFELTNRPYLVLRGEHGFVGIKGKTGLLQCNRSEYDVAKVTPSDKGAVFQGSNGKFWKVESDGTITITGAVPADFFIELRAHSRMCIVGPNGQYIKAAQNGDFTITGGTTVTKDTLWEY